MILKLVLQVLFLSMRSPNAIKAKEQNTGIFNLAELGGFSTCFYIVFYSLVYNDYIIFRKSGSVE